MNKLKECATDTTILCCYEDNRCMPMVSSYFPTRAARSLYDFITKKRFSELERYMILQSRSNQAARIGYWYGKLLYTGMPMAYLFKTWSTEQAVSGCALLGVKCVGESRRESQCTVHLLEGRADLNKYRLGRVYTVPVLTSTYINQISPLTIDVTFTFWYLIADFPIENHIYKEDRKGFLLFAPKGIPIGVNIFLRSLLALLWGSYNSHPGSRRRNTKSEPPSSKWSDRPPSSHQQHANKFTGSPA